MHKNETLLTEILEDLARIEETIERIGQDNPILRADRRVVMAQDHAILARNQVRNHMDAKTFVYTYGRALVNLELALALHKEKKNGPRPT